MTAVAENLPAESMWSPENVARRDGQARRLIKQAYKGDPEVGPYRKRFNAAKTVRKPMEKVWREVRDYLLPACGRYLDEDYGDPNDEDYTVCYSKIYDSSPTKMALTAADGLHGGLTNQAEQWFSLYVGNYVDYESTFSDEAKAWITNAQEATRDVMAQSNFYSAVYQLYLEHIGFGTALMLVLSDPISTARYYTKTIGSYWFVPDSRQRVETVFIRIVSRAEDIVRDYGEENCPRKVLEAMDQTGGADKKFNIIQCIQPWNYFGRNGNHEDWKYEDVRFLESGSDEDRILFRGGYRTKPFVAVRWADAGDYVYSRSCPGIDALPDVKQLQEMTLDYNKAVKWRVDPAWAHTSESDIGDAIVPGGIYKVTGNVRDNLLTALIPPEFDIPAATQAAQFLRDRISATLYNREILLVQSRERQITATEVNQLIQEKNAVLGPIIARIGDNALIPILDRTFEIETVEWNILLDPPEEIQGLEVKPYFTGQLAKAQRQGGVVQQIQQTVEIAMAVGQLDPQALLNFDLDAMLHAADEIDLFLPGTIRSKDKVEELRQQQQQAMQQQQQMAAMQQGVDMAKTAGDTSMAPDTLMGQLAGGGEAAI